MKLKNAARYFDTTQAVDAYNSTTKVKCQLEPLDMYRTEGTRIKVRNMSTAVGVAIPARKVIKIDSQAYLVSDSSYDYWKKEAVRARYVIQGADYVVEIRTIKEVLEETPGTLAYASIDFNKYSTDERDSSEYHPQYHIFFGNEEVGEDYIVSTSDRFFLVRNSYRTPSGLIDALSNQLDSPVTDSATLNSREYQPITDSYVDTPTTVRCLRIRWQDHFTYLSQGTQKYERGDAQILLPLSMSPSTSDHITLSDGVWVVLSVQTKAGYHSLHVRRV